MESGGLHLNKRGLSLISVSSGRHCAPLDRLAAAVDERALLRPVDADLFRSDPGLLLERDGVAVRREAVVLRTVERRECLELVQPAGIGEHLGVGLDRDRRVEEPSGADDVQFFYHWMRRRVGAQEET